ncbi:DUF397 domain-containing protein [Micromonospora sp. CV4]|uniref:DUF397 domain-containing protein n=1 Tax=Micromonospora sp. CV4 TaxID=2478711 RepID=UPI000EF5567B|nr:DUF397 domain-containing protein [Micromonospora sp. CV4]RLP96473.1 DUF397 domain-containing protein [Micromonospora sp. CV4]
MTDLTGASWRKSTRGGGNGGNRVEVVPNLPGLVPERDSKDLLGYALAFRLDTWRALITSMRQPHPNG